MIVPETRLRAKILVTGLMIVLGGACAPEPTEVDTSVDLSGVWTSNAHLFFLSQISMKLVQEQKGVVSGTWTAKGDGGTGGCPPNTPCDASGTVIGLNTVSKSDIELLGAATFEGVLVEPGKLRGALIHPIGYDTITFIRTSK
ncbi:MAG TPA: hypothetical protein VNC11_13230 [Gemmatimonadaceae bacterium]|jgi:hypothetical protein|nr:hypothetical protein [Gemmatimonadaceae bacterium]